jgi:aryl-alcohol dehydrogenase-like predicted oxidoreductase
MELSTVKLPEEGKGPEQPRVEYRSLGRTGVQVSSFCLGCMMFGGRTDAVETARIVDRALEDGVNFIDTANVYGHGQSEEFVGRALKANGKRERTILATKVWGTMDASDPNGRGTSRRAIVRACEDSLRRLQTDYVDVYYVHRAAPEIAIDETLRGLDDLVRAGKVRYIGSSTSAAWQVVESLWAAKELGLNRFVCEQPPYNMLDRRIEREVVPMAQTFGIALMPWSPLAQGFLAGKYRRGSAPPAGSRFEDAEAGKAWEVHGFSEGNPGVWSEAAWALLDTVEELARDKGCTPSQFALAWTAAQPGITSVIIGPRTFEQLEDNLGAVGVEITPADRARIDAVAPPGRATLPYWTANFGPHPYRAW